MDIQAASNFERLYFEATGRDAPATKAAFEGFAREGRIDIPPDALGEIQSLFDSAAVDDREVMATIRAMREGAGELIDPHTAVGVTALQQRAADLPGPVVVLSTAHPAKFPEDVERASGVAPALPFGVADLAARPERFERLPPDVAAVTDYVRAFAQA
jgi:threonine synthase